MPLFKDYANFVITEENFKKNDFSFFSWVEKGFCSISLYLTVQFQIHFIEVIDMNFFSKNFHIFILLISLALHVQFHKLCYNKQ